ncbi:MAG: coproporphyrinogen oxidase [Candidatus Sericytochromatia bacterium]|nr:MAG: coproporphyrinogen oxidase [Candidatus Sericytochromatia bacterium]
MNKYLISNFFKDLQNDICKDLEIEDGKSQFKEDLWERTGGGGGRTRIISNGNIIEKGGVNFSAVYGEIPSKVKNYLNVEGKIFFATGVSVVIHPLSPMIPIIHMNVRYFEIDNNLYWFGGGIDLTPHYVNKKDAYYFHNELKKICDKYDKNYYQRFKKSADDYFFIKHRNETRGIGGIFFDRLNEINENKTKEELFNFVKDIGNSFSRIYINLIRENKNKTYSDKEKLWQSIRRSRYVEFNLIYDAGTKFGLETNGRTESILMSLPPQAIWLYDYKPEKNSKEEETLNLLKKGINFLEYE